MEELVEILSQVRWKEIAILLLVCEINKKEAQINYLKGSKSDLFI
ncbi:hypothetical protein [Enterococcus wangshanyuanii]|uniref:Uncharacterized protein n=1 Tax=Enterococcus wangshanyuanii TaxID=2005703 RepID=A0ABQ1NEM6_9ENTE|nr:hypothetical protein [Enterococcus wangshanyuanii]GGC74720.1 hypothetical protein GCM10011573_00290 [Enterococcus wangshanyuanii]